MDKEGGKDSTQATGEFLPQPPCISPIRFAIVRVLLLQRKKFQLNQTVEIGVLTTPLALKKKRG
jgi:hypothetical protein